MHIIEQFKPLDVKSNTYIDPCEEINKKGPKFIICDIVSMSKYKNIFAEGCTPNWSEEFLPLKKLEILCHGHMF